MLVNNETGIIQPIRKIVELAHKKDALVHCDAVQGFGKIPVDINKLDRLRISFNSLFLFKALFYNSPHC